MVELLHDIRADNAVSTAAHWEDSNKIRDGILVRVPEETFRYGSLWKVEPATLYEKTAEMTNASSRESSVFGTKPHYSWL